MGNYTDYPKWADIAPFPQDDGGPNPLAAISYTEGYAEAMSYLRAVMAANELSERALELTEDIIGMNPAHYTVWLYRSRILTSLSHPLGAEVQWLNAVALRHQKNYQIWHHRQYLLDLIGSPAGEIAFVNRMLQGDAKNYHVWSYRQWLVRRFGLWEGKQGNGRRELGDEAREGEEEDGEEGEAPGLVAGAEEEVAEETSELEETAIFIHEDVRNNSAWNHRFFIVNGNEESEGVKDAGVYEREVAFAEEAIRKAPQNQSPWSYLRGTVGRAKGKEGLKELTVFCEEFVDLRGEGTVRSSHALDMLAEIWGMEDKREEARTAYGLLASRYDPIRTNYWNYLKAKLGTETVAAAA
ncbi:protein farnesyltransferase/geranylgeranyltransferase type-1 subunit alpha [Elsinoe australis]|uniref:Protein farnesyltransferase/geranylgeranyltransferase type-1 subunit alpha n=1 Tax=Elsinoe australis TaxID=40998 RepID=A0A4U7B2X3_9PEZI|nr:protein farnesyltransferase/geranylgeranyltransferase type-1 subunit alpha [Elsinoe australis]